MVAKSRIIRVIPVMGYWFALICSPQIHAQTTTPQVTIEARFLEVTIDNMRSLGFEFQIDGPGSQRVDAVHIDIGSAFDPNARAVTVPEGWTLDTGTEGTYKFEGSEVSLPIKIEALSRTDAQNLIGSARLMLQNEPFLEIPNLNIQPMPLPDVPAVKLDISWLSRELEGSEPGSGAGCSIRPYVKWQNWSVNVGDLETAAQTHKTQQDTFPDFTTWGETFDNFSRARIGSQFSHPISDRITLNLDAAYQTGCRRMYRQGWSYDPDPSQSNQYELDFGFSTFSLGGGFDYRFANHNGSAEPIRFGGRRPPDPVDPSDGPRSCLDRLELSGGFNLDFNHLNVDYRNEMTGGTMPYLDTGTLKGDQIGFSFNVGARYNIFRNFYLGFDVGYTSAKFDDISGTLQTETGAEYDMRLIMTPVETGDYITAYPADQPLNDNQRPATIDLSGFTWFAALYYEIPVGCPFGGGKKDDDDGTSPSDTPPPTIYGEELESEENVWNAYVYIGDISGPASIYEAAIIAAADEAQSDFEDAGYNVISNYHATYQDFQTVMDDGQARAFWFAGHGTEDDNGPLPMIREARGEGVSPSRKYYPAEASVLFRKPNLNQVTMHACKQDLPEWRNAFPGATYDSWSISPIGPMMYWWQFACTYPKIDPETGQEIGKRSDGIAPVTPRSRVR